MKKIGVTLGGGGAKGFAHIPILEAFDELGVKPYCMSGTSIGAIVAALYASGHSAADMAEIIRELIIPKDVSIKELFRSKDTLKILNLLDPDFSFKPQGLLRGEKILGYLLEHMQVSTFEELRIPLTTVATDFWRMEPVVSDAGELQPAVHASMAIPYLFTPVMDGDRVLVDGGLTNNVPLDLLCPQCDIRIAVDIMGTTSNALDKVPSARDAVFHTYQVMMNATTQEKLANHPVDIYVQPPLVGIDILDFHKPWEIYEQAQAAKEGFKRQLDALLGEKRRWFRKK